MVTLDLEGRCSLLNFGLVIEKKLADHALRFLLLVVGEGWVGVFCIVLSVRPAVIVSRRVEAVLRVEVQMEATCVR